MQDGIHLLHGPGDGAGVPDVAPDRIDLLAEFPGQLARGRPVEVEGTDLVPLAEQLGDGVGADVAEGAGEEDLHEEFT